ncbi:MAG TPA: META domain-containing protein, partial [Acidimicrobiales bacterium]|nr:META domain-containing protein [Acidimicrobiales bacterium]
MPNVTAYSIDGSNLTLKDKSGSTLFVYAENTITLEGTAWTATGVNNGKNAVQSTAQTEHLTAVFGSDGALSGSGGCNDFNATYTVSGKDGLTIGPIASTKKACADDVMTEETAYFTALGNVAKFEIDGDTLTLRDSSGSTQVTYVAS